MAVIKEETVNGVKQCWRLSKLVTQDRQRVKQLLKIKWSKYIPHTPYPKQLAFLWLTCRDAFYGGAASGGKSEALLMAALQWVDVPGYNALLIRDTYNNLNKPEGLMSRAHEWLGRWASEVKWNNETKTFHFTKYGSSLGFGYLDGPRDHFNFLSAAYQFVGIDEVVGIREHQALYLFSRLRRLMTMPVPIRFRAASNPPAFEQIARGEWVKERYVDKKTRKKGCVFIPADKTDNPHVDGADYSQSLSNLDPVTRRQLEEGDWDIAVMGRFFEIENIELVDTYPVARAVDVARRWDLAATPEPTKKSRQEGSDSGPAWTCGVKGTIVDGIFYVIDVRRGRLLPGPGDQFIQTTAVGDGIGTRQVAEQEPGSSGKRDIWHLSTLVPGLVGIPSTGSKILRARPFASAMSMSKVKFLRAPWNKTALKELMLFPDGKFKDFVDAASGLYLDLTGAGSSVGAILPGSTLEQAHNEMDQIYG